MLLLLLLLTCCHLSCLHGLELGHLLWVHEAVLSHGHSPWLHLVHLLRHQLLLSLLLDRLQSLLLHLLGCNYKLGVSDRIRQAEQVAGQDRDSQFIWTGACPNICAWTWGFKCCIA